MHAAMHPGSHLRRRGLPCMPFLFRIGAPAAGWRKRRFPRPQG